MSDVSQYLIKVVCAAIFCGMINQLIKGNMAVSAIVKTVTGLFVAITVLSPLVNFKIDTNQFSFDTYLQDGMQYASGGENYAADKRTEIIIDTARTYILNKAASLGAELEVEIVLSGNETEPFQSVMLRGDISPYAKNQLSQMITGDLGIPKEAQQWIN